MNVNLGDYYQIIISKAIQRGLAGNQTEVIRQALLDYGRKIDEEEAMLVHKAVELEMQEIDSGKVKTYTYDQIKKRLGL
jgi:Arc/MetJ-type ribon-helix-helix transcriptional regulator